AEQGLEPLGDGPHLEAHLAVPRDLLEELLHAALLGGDHVEERVAGLDEVFDFPLAADALDGVHGTSALQLAQRAEDALHVLRPLQCRPEWYGSGRPYPSRRTPGTRRERCPG